MTREQMNALKKKMERLPVEQRMAEEVKLARASGIMLTTVEASALAGGGGEIMTRIVDEGPAQKIEPGHAVDLGVRGNLAAMMKANPFPATIATRGLAEAIKAIDAGNIEEFLVRHDGHLDLLSATGGSPAILKSAKVAVAKHLFGNVDPSAGSDGFGGVKNS
ncbi:MAG TPA: hypothetical protein VLQ65_05270 [Saliniramus sp.]|nr:hypothetical protein [Saliniramus sp.]